MRETEDNVEEVVDATTTGNPIDQYNNNDQQRHVRENIFQRISSSVDFMMGSICSLLLTGILLWFECIFHLITFPLQGQNDSFTRVSTRNGQISMLYSHPDYECGYQTKELTLLSIFLLLLHTILYQLGGLELIARSTLSSLKIHYNPGFQDIIPNRPLISVTTYLIEMLQDWLKASIIGSDSQLQRHSQNNWTQEKNLNVVKNASIEELDAIRNVDHATVSLILPPIVLGLFLLFTVILFLFGHLFFLLIIKLSRWFNGSNNSEDTPRSTNISTADDEPNIVQPERFPLGPIHTVSSSRNSSDTISSILFLFGLIVVFVLETILPWVMLGTGTYICLYSISFIEYDSQEAFVFGLFQYRNFLDWALFIPVLLLSGSIWWTIFCGVRMLRSGIYRSLQDGIDTEAT